ncbi:MAG: TetR/AcrR family transcriptional regulator [Parvibaculales bacterium]
MNPQPASPIKRSGIEPLLLGGYQILAQKGLDALTYRALAAKLNCSVGTLSYHFPQKEDLLTAILASQINPRWRPKLRHISPQEPLVELCEIVKQILPLTNEMDMWWRARLNLFAFRAGHPKLRAEMKKGFLETEAFYAQKFNLLKRQNQKQLAVTMTAQELSRHFILLLEGAGASMLQLSMPERSDYGAPILNWLNGLVMRKNNENSRNKIS